MEIIVNNQPHTVSENTSLLQLAEKFLGDKQKGVAIAVNAAVIPKTTWTTTTLQPNDHVIIIKATQGG